MTTLQSPPVQIMSLVDRLARTYAPAATRTDVAICVNSAWDAVRLFGADGVEDISAVAGRIAERDLRLRLGLDREAARLDPEKHAPR